MSDRLTAACFLAWAAAACAGWWALQPAQAANKHPDEANAVVVHVSPTGSDSAQGDEAHPFRTLERARQAVREANSAHSVTVRLATGIYRLTQPLIFSAADGGRNGHHVTWAAEPGAVPIVSGAIAVSGWKVSDRTRHIYVADVPVGLDSRQLWIDDQLAKRARVEVPRSAVEFSSHLSPHHTSEHSSEAKVVAAGLTDARTLVLGADSTLVLDGISLGKPGTAEAATQRWKDMRGHRGTLLTGHCVIDVETGKSASAVGSTEVYFGTPSDAEIAAYVATGEPIEVAGAFTLDGRGAPFVDRIEGDHSNVVGLSLPVVRRLLAELGVGIVELWD